MKALLLAVAVGAVACSNGAASPDAAIAPEIIGGKVVASMPGVVHLDDGCTAAKVGRRTLLTAAHCVVSLSTMDAKYDMTHPVRLAVNAAAGHVAHAVTATAVHPAFATKCAETLCSIAAVVAKVDAPDVALLAIADDLPEVAIVPISTVPLAVGEAVELVGYGCTAGVHVADDRAVTTLATAESVVVAPATAVHDGSPVADADLPVVSGNYALTAGTAGLCPGDSGGPLFARRGGAIQIVGVNANYTLRPDEDDAVGVPVTNWHTRLDTASRNDVAAWIVAQLH